jgi:CheY-like chemotaxis protein
VRNVFALTSIFEPRGARILAARNGREALEQVRAHRPDLVLMDIMMPEMTASTRPASCAGCPRAATSR